MQQPAFDSLPLGLLPVGVCARVVEIRGGRELVRKLLALGIRIGSEVRVEHHRGRGLVVSAGATRVALGGGIVEKLTVVPLGTAGQGLSEQRGDCG
jgi:ferrous iron transport protein A